MKRSKRIILDHNRLFLIRKLINDMGGQKVLAYHMNLTPKRISNMMKQKSISTRNFYKIYKIQKIYYDDDANNLF